MREAALAKAPQRPSYRLAAAMSGIAAAAAGALLWLGVATNPVDGPVGPRGADMRSASVENGIYHTGIYHTGIGERSAILLPDGSLATLDTDSELQVNYSRSERAVILAKGQALFEVAEGKPLPFQVYAGDQRITAIGTTFNVKLHGGQVRVSMVEGVVKVRPTKPPKDRGAPVQELTLRAGESLVAGASLPATVQSVDTSQVATWRGGMIVFEDEKLSEAIAEINRYTNKPIRLADASVGEYRVTGVFKTNDPARFARAMSEVFPVEVERRADGSAVLKAER
ncbi:MAG TPA: FecR domain-containing protein [Sphingomicrobium sp.]|nr:FecR domain-containing protein [Sphingomicrobium sp.]